MVVVAISAVLCSVTDVTACSDKVRFEGMWHGKRGSKLQLDGIPFMIVGNRYMECHGLPPGTTAPKICTANGESYRFLWKSVFISLVLQKRIS